ncbi:MAG TPA: AAA family ATPase [Gaiellaceae bacterium]|nr:AAA family ATPase [Gaiellaceae bacterium]
MRVNVKGISGSGKTTFARDLAERLRVPFLELDAVHHIGPNWTEATPEELEQSVREFMARAPGGWVIDGNYESKLGEIVIDAADRIVWLDPPLRVPMRRLWRRTHGRIRDDVELWGGNRESWRSAFLGWDSLFVYAVRSWVRHKRQWPRRFSGDPRVVRLRSTEDARRWLESQ